MSRGQEVNRSTGQEDWNLEEPGLSPQDPIKVLMDRSPYKMSEDKKGHDCFLGGRFPKNFARWVDKIRELPGSPYEIRSDIARDALYLGLIILSLRYNLHPEWKMEEQLAQNAAKTEEEAEIFSKEESFVKSLEKLCNNGNTDQAKENLQSRLEILNSFPDSKRKEDHLRILKKRLNAHGLGELL